MSTLASSLTPSLLVALGGAVGAVGRYHLGRAATHIMGPNTGFPWGTLAANVIGSLAMGLLIAALTRYAGGPTLAEKNAGLLLGVGLLGGFTTFSAFSLELVLMIQRGSLGLALVYAALSVLAGVGALYLGLSFTRVAP